MRSLTTNLQLTRPAGNDIIDVTDELERAVKDSGVTDGCIVAFCAHTTATLVLGEWENGLLEDFRRRLLDLAPPTSTTPTTTSPAARRTSVTGRSRSTATPMLLT